MYLAYISNYEEEDMISCNGTHLDYEEYTKDGKPILFEYWKPESIKDKEHNTIILHPEQGVPYQVSSVDLSFI